MLFALPIGIFLLLGEKKARASYQAIFDNFYQDTQNSNYAQKQKMDLYEKMLHKNDYIIVEKNQDKVVGEKKIFSVGWMFIGIGTLYVGLLAYIVYFLYFQKPHVVRFIVS
jgi:uncharacterized membrane protein YukC